ncbi:MAG: hypothetical protein JEZ02_00270 [Desulfatibacillum sp.]|nr:hypothetical protein [Desulfatibacillum sp.]
MYIRSLTIFLIATTALYAASIVLAQQVVGFYGAPVHDEVHFLVAIKLFGSGVSLENLAGYNETSGPLPFILYGLWGRFLGFGMPTLRFLSLLVGFGALSLIHYFLYDTLNNKKQALVGALFIAVNPYMMALSVLVYTDMMALLFLFGAVLAFKGEKPWLYGTFMALALLCRQYFVFFPLAVGVAAILRLIVNRQGRAYKMIVASVVSVFPLALLMIVVWGGVCPQNATRAAWVDGMTGFHPRFVTLYVAMLAVYMLPYLVYKAESIYVPWAMGFAVALSVLYLIFPAGASPSGLRYGLVFTGFFHRFLSLVSTKAWFYHMVLYGFFLAGIPLVLGFFKSLGKGFVKKEFDMGFVLDLALILFFVLMAFSYLSWEKYLLPVLPMALARIAAMEKL